MSLRDSGAAPLNFGAARAYIAAMRVLCVGRHRFLSEHLCRFFGELGMATVPAVGLDDAMGLTSAVEPDVIVCDYDLLATARLDDWERHAQASHVPVIAVSLTRHPGEAHLLDVNGIAGFLYLPTLQGEDARRVLSAVARTRGVTPPAVLPWSGQAPIAELR